MKKQGKSIHVWTFSIFVFLLPAACCMHAPTITRRHCMGRGCV